MKRSLVALAFFAGLFGLAAQPAMAFTSTQTAKFGASVLVGGTKTASFSFVIRATSAPISGGTHSTITWTNAVSGSSWAIADRLVVITATVTDSDGGIQFYTDNSSSTAYPKFVDPTPGDTTNADSNPAGLLRVVAGTTTSSDTLPVAWTIKDSTQTVGGSLQSSDPNSGPSAGAGNRFQWLFMLDKNTPAISGGNPFSNGMKYVMTHNNAGIHYGQGDAEFASLSDGLPAYLYLEANFANAAAQSTYQSTHMTLEAFLQ